MNETLDSIKQRAYDAKDSVEQKALLHEEIEKQTKVFLKRGGKIKLVGILERKPYQDYKFSVKQRQE